MTGVSFINTKLDNILMENCMLKYANFCDTNLYNVLIKNSNMEEARFMNVKQKNFSLENNNLKKMEIIDTNMNMMDLSSCDIEGIKFDHKSFKGIIIDISQSPYIVSNLGIKFK